MEKDPVNNLLEEKVNGKTNLRRSYVQRYEDGRWTNCLEIEAGGRPEY